MWPHGLEGAADLRAAAIAAVATAVLLHGRLGVMQVIGLSAALGLLGGLLGLLPVAA